MSAMGMILYGKDAPDPPAPVDPANQVRAQAAATPSAFTPYGSRVYTGDPNVPGSFRYTETFSPQVQKQFDAKNRIAEAILGRTERQLPNIPEKPIEAGMGDAGTQAYWNREKGLLDQVYKEQDDRLDQKLANQGLPMGSEAYKEERDRFDTTQAANYERAAQGAVGAGFNQALAARQQNYNELAAALGGQQLTPINTQPGSFVDPTAAQQMYQQGVNNQYQGQLANHNANVATQNSAMGSAATVAAAMLMFSDERLKEDVTQVGQTNDGVPIYTYRYIGDPKVQMGVMAQELEETNPEAVYDIEGVKMVDYGAVS
jgi:hypothetical protein